jgi:hypothetical protein
MLVVPAGQRIGDFEPFTPIGPQAAGFVFMDNTFLRTSSRCHRRRVARVTRKLAHRSRGRAQLAEAGPDLGPTLNESEFWHRSGYSSCLTCAISPASFSAVSVTSYFAAF